MPAVTRSASRRAAAAAAAAPYVIRSSLAECLTNPVPPGSKILFENSGVVAYTPTREQTEALFARMNDPDFQQQQRAHFDRILDQIRRA